MSSLPAIKGKQLVRLLEKDGWQNRGKSQHGIYLFKIVSGDYRFDVIPNKSRPLPHSLLSRILSSRQSGIGRTGLRTLVEKYGI